MKEGHLAAKAWNRTWRKQGHTFEDLNTGIHKEFIMERSLPSTGVTGIYTVKRMVLTDWPSKGGKGIVIETLNFSVT